MTVERAAIAIDPIGLPLAFGRRASARTLWPALFVAGLVHLSALLAIGASLPAKRSVPPLATALEILILHDPSPATHPPPADAPLSQRNRTGQSLQPPADPANPVAPDLATPDPEPLREAGDIEDTGDAGDAGASGVLAAISGTPIAPTPMDPPLPAPPDHAAIVTAMAPVLPVPELPPPPVDAARILASRASEIDRLGARLERGQALQTQRARRRAISASTREYRYASYLEAWARKVERIGNLNYPQAARDRQLQGNLILHVAVRADGGVQDIRVVRSSGQALLDEAAIRIVKLAAPFSPFPPDIAADTDILDIVRTWQFRRGALGWE